MTGGIPQFAIGSVILAGSQLESVATLVAQAGFAQLELMMDVPHFDGQPSRPAEIVEMLDRLGLEVRVAHGPIHDVDLGALDDSVRASSVQRVASCMPGAAAIGARRVVVHPNQYHEQPEALRRESRKQTLKSLAELASRASDAGLRIAVENVHGYRGPRVGDSASGLLELLETLPAHVGICIDTGHALLSGLDPAEQIRIAGERLQLLHLSDNDGTGDQHCVPGDGLIDWSAAIAAIRDIGFAEAMTLEIISTPDAAAAGLARCATIARDWARRIEGKPGAEVTLFPAAATVRRRQTNVLGIPRNASGEIAE